MRKLLALAAFAAIGFAIVPARADDKVTIVVSDGVRTQVMKDQVIYGRASRPLAVQDVAKLPMRSTLTDLRQPLVQRIEPPVQSAPF